MVLYSELRVESKFFFIIILEGNNGFNCLLHGAIVKGELNSITVTVLNRREREGGGEEYIAASSE